MKTFPRLTYDLIQIDSIQFNQRQLYQAMTRTTIPRKKPTLYSSCELCNEITVAAFLKIS